MNKITIGIMAHVNAGKTTLTEQFLYKTNSIRSLGRVDDGTAHTDFHAVESGRGISVFSAVTSFERNNTRINLIDTPGHREFAGELERCLPVLDCAILLVSAVEGVQCHTRVIANTLKKMNIPTVVFINKVDREGADVSTVIDELENQLEVNPIVLNDAINDGKFHVDDSEVADSVSMIDDGFCEKYMGEYPLSDESFQNELLDIVANGCFENNMVPVLTGAALKDEGVDRLLDFIALLGAYSKYSDKNIDAKELLDGKRSAVVFKVNHDKKQGRMVFFKLLKGSVKVRDSVEIFRSGVDVDNAKAPQEKITQLKQCYADRYEDCPVLQAGDVGVATGLSIVQTGDSFGDELSDVKCESIALPLMRSEVSPYASDDEAKSAQDFDAKIIELKNCLEILADEDPLLSFTYYNETRQMVVSLMGKIQIEILQYVLEERFGIKAYFKEPRVIYKETPASENYGFDAYTMPKPCWAILKFLITPLPRGSGFQYESKVPPKDIQYRYQNHVDIAIRRALKQGIKGWEVVDLKVTLVEGGDHNLHTHPLDFFVCTPMAFLDGLRNTGTKLLEPMYSFELSVPSAFGARVMGELLSMRAVLNESAELDGFLHMEGYVPVATSMDFNDKLMSMTKGEGVLQLEFSHYEDAPEDVDETLPYEGVNPLDRSKFILYARNALSEMI